LSCRQADKAAVAVLRANKRVQLTKFNIGRSPSMVIPWSLIAQLYSMKHRKHRVTSALSVMVTMRPVCPVFQLRPLRLRRRRRPGNTCFASVAFQMSLPSSKVHEQPCIGVLLRATKNDELVEFPLSRTLSPTLTAEYKTQLPDKSHSRLNSMSEHT
jgi:hypothetical protein